MMRMRQLLAAMLGAILLQATPAAAQERPISVRDSFPVGTGGETVCTAQIIARDPALSDMFDRGFSILCRDAAAPVGRIFALRTPAATRGPLPAGGPRAGDLRPEEARPSTRGPAPGDQMPPSRKRCRYRRPTQAAGHFGGHRRSWRA
jgi:hypothetical protein